MKRKTMKCPKKINKKCGVTGRDCDHAVKHKENQFCHYSADCCAECVEVKEC